MQVRPVRPRLPRPADDMRRRQGQPPQAPALAPLVLLVAPIAVHRSDPLHALGGRELAVGFWSSGGGVAVAVNGADSARLCVSRPRHHPPQHVIMMRCIRVVPPSCVRVRCMSTRPVVTKFDVDSPFRKRRLNGVQPVKNYEIWYSVVNPEMWPYPAGSSPLSIAMTSEESVGVFRDKVWKAVDALQKFDVAQLRINTRRKPGVNVKMKAPIGQLRSTQQSPVYVIVPRPRTVYIQDMDHQYRPKETFRLVHLESQSDFKKVLGQRGRALVKVTDLSKVVTKVKELKDGAKYRVCTMFDPFVSLDVY